MAVSPFDQAPRSKTTSLFLSNPVISGSVPRLTSVELTQDTSCYQSDLTIRPIPTAAWTFLTTPRKKLRGPIARLPLNAQYFSTFRPDFQLPGKSCKILVVRSYSVLSELLFRSRILRVLRPPRWAKMPEIIVFIISLAAVVFGADWLGNAATNIAKSLSLPRVLIGATIVSLATTLPEIVIAVVSGVQGEPEIGLGTVFGSPVVNIGLIFGTLLLFSEVRIEKAYFTRTIQFLLVVIALILLVSLTGGMNQLFGWILILLGLMYLMIQLVVTKHEDTFLEQLETRFERLKNLLTDGDGYHQFFYLVVGAVLLVLGGRFLVDSAVILAATLKVPELVIGLIAIAFGTSIPETFTAINSIIRKRPEISAGNLFGASVLDLTVALGSAVALGGGSFDSSNIYPIVGTITILCLIGFFAISGKIPKKTLGGLSILFYVIFVVFFAINHP